MSKSQAFFVFKISHRDPAVRSGSPTEIPAVRSGSPTEIPAVRSGSPAEIRLFVVDLPQRSGCLVLSPEGGTSLPVCVSHRTRHPPSAKPGGLAHHSGE